MPGLFLLCALNVLRILLFISQNLREDYFKVLTSIFFIMGVAIVHHNFVNFIIYFNMIINNNQHLPARIFL